MQGSPSVLVLDDGELDDVQQILDELNIACARVRGSAIANGTPAPKDLLVATPRRIDLVNEAVGELVDPPIRVMVVNEDSNGLRAQLRRNGFDYLVRRPVHREALRLLLMHCVYKGEERRNEPRVPVGFEVSYRTGLLTRRATLVDLSQRGCRLLSRTRVETGKKVRVLLREALDAGDPIALRGRVVRVWKEERESGEVFSLGVTFDKFDEDSRSTLEMIIEDHASGPATLRTGYDDVPRGDTSPPESETVVMKPEGDGAGQKKSSRRAPLRGVTHEINRTQHVDASTRHVDAAARNADAATPERSVAGQDAGQGAAIDERRRGPRSEYQQSIPAFGNRALRVLVGRDLSVGGMRIQPMNDLEIGDRLHLAVYGDPGDEPLLVWGTVARDDGASGQVVVFDALDSAAEARLEHLVSDLPAVESLHDSEAEAMGTVLTEILD